MAESESDLYARWMRRIAEREASLSARLVEWNRYLRFYRMRLTEEEAPEGDNVWVNMQFALSRVILPSIYYKNPDILVSPRKDTTYLQALLWEVLLNHQVEAIGLEQEMRKIVFDTLFCSLGVIKQGYEPALSGDTGTKYKEVERLMEEYSAGPGSLFDEEDQLEEPAEDVDPRITDLDPFAIRISPRYYLMDPLAACEEEARWKCHIVIKPADSVKQTKVYRRSLTKGIEGTFDLKEEHAGNEVPGGFSLADTESFRRLGTETMGLVKLYEVWDRETNELLVLDSWNMDKGEKKFLRRDKSPYKLSTSPFRTLVFNPDPDSPYGISDASVWFNPSNALNLMRSMQYLHVKRFIRKYITKRGTLKSEQMANLQNPVDGAVVEIDGELADLQALVDAPISGDLYRLSDDLRRDLNMISGVTEARKGEANSRTATEASFVEQQSQLRDSDRLLLVAKFVKGVVQTMAYLDRKFLGAEYVSHVCGVKALQYWQENADSILQAPVDINIRVGSSSFISREIRTVNLLKFLEVTNQMVDPSTGQPVVNAFKVVGRVAEALEIDDYQELLNLPIQPPGLTPPGGLPLAPGQGQPPIGNTTMGSMLSGVQRAGQPRNPQGSVTTEAQ